MPIGAVLCLVLQLKPTYLLTTGYGHVEINNKEVYIKRRRALKRKINEQERRSSRRIDF
jgi:hypothetical protein